MAGTQTGSSETMPAGADPADGTETDSSETDSFKTEAIRMAEDSVRDRITESEPQTAVFEQNTEKAEGVDPETDNPREELSATGPEEPEETKEQEPDPLRGLFASSKNSIVLTPGLSEEELAELLGPIREPQRTMPELSKEELEELLAPAARHELTDEGPVPEPDDEDEYISSVMSEVDEDDDPEIKALAKQIAELERQEHVEKYKKKSKKGKKRKR